MHLKHFALSLLLSTICTAKAYSKAKDAVLLSKVRSLTLQADKQTSHRRVKAIPQLTCVGGSACPNGKPLYQIDVMRCKNSGSEYDPEDIQWTCQASLPPEIKLGGTEVVCEGYDSSEDPYVLKGSCGVEYRLVLTQAGEEIYRGKSSWTQRGSGDSYRPRSSETSLWKTATDSFFTLMFWAVFAVIVCIVLYRILFPNRRVPFLPNLPVGGGGGGWGGGNDDDPPPPYTPRGPPRPKTQPRESTYSSPRNSRGASSAPSSGPGFWTGAAAGAAAGYGASYLTGSRTREREQEERRREQARQSSWFGAPSGSRGSPWHGRGEGSGSSSSAPGPSTSRYESTGFGGTRRR